jgi:3-oxoacyl-[acyl-carrier-protein] synthase II
MTIAIQGVGVAGGFGSGLESLSAALSNKGPHIQRVQVKTSNGPCEMPAYLADTSRLDDFLNKRALRRVYHYSKMALLGAYLALQDAGRLDGDRSRMGIIVASGYGPSRTTLGFLDTFINDGDSLSSPTYFSNSVQNAAVANISMLMNITGPGLTVSQFEMSVPSALIAAKNWLEEGRVDSVLFGAVDEYHDVLGYYWHRYYGELATADHEIRPFEYDLQTAVPGEGAAFFLLTRAENEGAFRYGCIEDVMMGRCGRSPLTIASDALLFIGADGHKHCGGYYKQYIPENAGMASYTPLYGSFPTGPAFDVAIAALSIKNGKFYCNNTTPGAEHPYDERSLNNEQIGCLKMSSSGELGLIRLSKEK